MDEPQPLLAMSPGRKWWVRISATLWWLALVVGFADRLRSPSFSTFGIVAWLVLIVLTTIWLVRVGLTLPRGHHLAPPNEYDPARYPPEQRGRARMDWPDWCASWGCVGLLAVLVVGGAWVTLKG